MQRKFVAFATVALVAIGFGQVFAQTPVTWDGGNGNWQDAHWTKNAVSGQTASAAMGDNTGGRGGMAISVGGGAIVTYDPNALGDFKPRMDINGPGSVTIKEGAVLQMDSHSDADGKWTRVDANLTLDGGTLRRTKSGPSLAGGTLFFGYSDLQANQKINVNIINGGRIENDAKMSFGKPDYFQSQGGGGGHKRGIEIAMTINNGTLDLTGGGNYQDYFGQVDGEMIFAYEYEENVGPKNEKYSVNFTGPGSITVDPFDTGGMVYKGGIYVALQDSSGAYSALGGAPDLYTPIGYEDLWALGILQANGQSGLTGANFSTYFTTTGTKFTPNYTLTSMVAPPGLAGDYNNNGKVDAADYVLWRNGGPLQNEVDTPGTVNAADFAAWRARFGNAAGSGSGLGAGAVPEPAACALFVGAMALLAVRRNPFGRN